MKKYELYLFDFDGTIVDSFASLDVIFKKSYAAVGISIDHEEVVRLSREPLDVGFWRLGGKKEDIALFAKTLEETLDSYDALILTKKYPETDALIKTIKEKHLLCGVVTSNKVKHVYEVLDFFNDPLSIFDYYVGNEHFKHYKPDPEPILIALKKAGYLNKKDRVVYVGDSINDVKSGISAGIDAVLVDREGNHKKINDQYLVIQNLLELFE